MCLLLLYSKRDFGLLIPLLGQHLVYNLDSEQETYWGRFKENPLRHFRIHKYKV